MTQIIAKINTESTNNVILDAISASNQIRYNAASIAPYYSEMENWEAKEYQAVCEESKAELNELAAHMMANESVYNQMLSKYNMSVAVFIGSLRN